MRRWILAPFAVMIIGIWITMAVTAWRSADIIAPAIADNLVVDSPREQILSAREADAAAERAGGGWAGWLAFGLLLVVAVSLAVMTVATPFLKEKRLSLKEFRRSRDGRRQSLPTIISQMPNVSHVPQLPDGGEQQWQENYPQQQ